MKLLRRVSQIIFVIKVGLRFCSCRTQEEGQVSASGYFGRVYHQGSYISAGVQSYGGHDQCFGAVEPDESDFVFDSGLC